METFIKKKIGVKSLKKCNQNKIFNYYYMINISLKYNLMF
jgi:hypothetical protein